MSQFENIKEMFKENKNDLIEYLKVISILHINHIFLNHETNNKSLNLQKDLVIYLVKLNIRNNFLKKIDF
ncbi:hypothetical protein A0H76_449 [Hepatospora eriocheir]|uniref:Uncharacterized protein n=1 Tax=Hepatospora eriocheir TaxID=1081669 RepID=A0A1X0QIS2_9MICR|nr:hypothetical protein A0H76_449 [Hepatospora eriocheir]